MWILDLVVLGEVIGDLVVVMVQGIVYFVAVMVVLVL